MTTGKHLGVKIQNDPKNIIGQDIKEKRAQYIQRNNELAQEFAFANCETIANINRLYNSHFTGSVFWNLCSKEADMTYNTWSVSIRKMFRLDRKTHRYLIEPVSKMQHIKISLMKRFVKFAESLAETKKGVVRNVYNTLVNDCRSTVGMNTRLIQLACNTIKASTKDIEKQPFFKMPQCKVWRVGIIEDLINIRDNQSYLNSIDWKKEEVAEALHHACTSQTSILITKQTTCIKPFVWFEINSHNKKARPSMTVC